MPTLSSAILPSSITGNIIFLTGSTSYSVTLPLARTVAAGTGYTFSVTGTGAVNIRPMEQTALTWVLSLCTLMIAIIRLRRKLVLARDFLGECSFTPVSGSSRLAILYRRQSARGSGCRRKGLCIERSKAQ